jgi:Tol biopolymer transport system component
MGNGYGKYPPQIAWSPVENVLVAALEDSIVMWEEHFGTTLIAQREASSPTFSPDGRYAAFVMDREIYYLDIDHPESPRRLVQAGRAATCTFDPLAEPENPVLCYTTDFLGSQIFAVSLRAGDVVQLLPDDTDARLNAPVLSPNGRNIACVNFESSLTWWEELYILGASAPEGRRARRLLSWEGSSDWHESNPVWIDDELLLFQIGGWGEWELRFLSLRAGGEKVLLDNAHQPCAALGGRYLAFCRNDPFMYETSAYEDPTGVWVMDRETGYLIQASEPGEWAEQPAISHDGEYIAWIRVLPDGEELAVHESEAFITLP